MFFGNELNLAKPKKGAELDVEGRRRAGPSNRVDIAARDTLAAVFRRWVTDPLRDTEVAETRAAVVSEHCDATAGADGWTAVADQWLQPGGLARDDFSICYRLLYSLSQHFDTDLI